MNREQAVAISEFIEKMRPTWSKRDVYHALKSLAGESAYDVALASMHAAHESTASPGDIPRFMHGHERPAAPVVIRTEDDRRASHEAARERAQSEIPPPPAPRSPAAESARAALRGGQPNRKADSGGSTGARSDEQEGVGMTTQGGGSEPADRVLRMPDYRNTTVSPELLGDVPPNYQFGGHFPPPEDPNEPISPRQSRLMHAVMGRLGFTREERLAYCQSVLGHEIESTNELTKGEATLIIDKALAAEADLADDGEDNQPGEDQ